MQEELIHGLNAMNLCPIRSWIYFFMSRLSVSTIVSPWLNLGSDPGSISLCLDSLCPPLYHQGLTSGRRIWGVRPVVQCARMAHHATWSFV